MPEQSEPGPGNQKENPAEMRLEKWARRVMEGIFDAHPDDPQTRIAALLGRIGFLLHAPTIDRQAIEASLRELTSENDRERFVSEALERTRPILDFVLNHPEEFRAMTSEARGYEYLNEVFMYGITENSAHIHLSLSQQGPLETLALYAEGLLQLIDIVEANPQIAEITAESELLQTKGKLAESFGFTVDPKKRTRATIFREDFLNSRERYSGLREMYLKQIGKKGQ